MKLSDITNLAISGAGVKIVGQIGALSVIEEKGLLKQIKSISGTSAGSIVGTLVSIGYTSEELKKICFELDFSQFEDGTLAEKVNVLRDYGLNKGDTFLKFIQEKIEAKTGSKYTTFAGLYAQGMKDLHIVACRLNDRSKVVFSYKDTPNVAVCDAVRCSMSIPLEFEPHKIYNDNSTYVDGGVVLNYPLKLFPENNTIGICFDPFENVAHVDLTKGQFPLYLKLMIESFMAAQDEALKLNSKDLERSILLNSCGVSATNFKLTETNKLMLFANGKQQAIKFFDKLGVVVPD